MHRARGVVGFGERTDAGRYPKQREEGPSSGAASRMLDHQQCLLPFTRSNEGTPSTSLRRDHVRAGSDRFNMDNMVLAIRIRIVALATALTTTTPATGITFDSTASPPPLHPPLETPPLQLVPLRLIPPPPCERFQQIALNRPEARTQHRNWHTRNHLHPNDSNRALSRSVGVHTPTIQSPLHRVRPAFLNGRRQRCPPRWPRETDRRCCAPLRAERPRACGWRSLIELPGLAQSSEGCSAGSAPRPTVNEPSA